MFLLLSENMIKISKWLTINDKCKGANIIYGGGGIGRQNKKVIWESVRAQIWGKG